MESTTSTAERVVVSGSRQVVLPADPTSLDPFELRTRTASVDCASGESETGEWRGIRIGDLLERADADGNATHVVVTGDDGYRVCVPVLAALDGLLAFDRLDDPEPSGLPRLVAADVEGTRSVKRVDRIETVALDSDEDSARHENLTNIDDAW